MEELFEKLCQDFKNTMSQEMDRLIHTGSSYVGTALREAERNGFEITVDVDVLDSRYGYSLKNLE